MFFFAPTLALSKHVKKYYMNVGLYTAILYSLKYKQAGHKYILSLTYTIKYQSSRGFNFHKETAPLLNYMYITLIFKIELPFSYF